MSELQPSELSTPALIALEQISVRIDDRDILKQIDWANRQVELRSLFDVDSMSDMVEEYEEL